MFKVCYFDNQNKLVEEFCDKLVGVNGAHDIATQWNGYIEGMYGFDGGHKQSNRDYLQLNARLFKPEWYVSFNITDVSGNQISSESEVFSLEEALAFKSGLEVLPNLKQEISIIHLPTSLNYFE